MSLCYSFGVINFFLKLTLFSIIKYLNLLMDMMKTSTAVPTKLSLMKQFVVIYVLLLTLMLAVIVGWYWFSIGQEYKSIKQKEHLLLHVHRKAILDEYRSVLSDLINLASLPVHLDRGASSSNYKHVKPELAKTYLSYAKTRGRYDQIRYLDNQGREIVRINDYDGHPQVVPDSQLQDKSSRYYVKTISQLSSNQIYVSKMDLNVEQGKVELPPKPVIRIGIGLYDKNKQQQGMLILNYLGNWLFESMENAHRAYEQRSFLYLLNRKGYWLRGPNKDKEFGFMYANKQNVTLANESPKLWQEIKHQKEGQLLTDKGLYSYSVFNPLNPRFSLEKGLYNFADKQFVGDKNEQYEWVLMSFLPKSSFSSITNEQVKRGLPYVAIAITLMAFLAFILAGYRVDQVYLRNKIKHMAYHDELTGLLNRHSLTSEEGKIFFKQTEDQRPSAVFFLDLDGFKPINDKHGHQIGDEVLKIVAKRIISSVRSEDIVVRVGGDEFAVITCDTMAKEGAEHLAQQLIDKIGDTIHIGDKQLQLGASIGIACYPENGSEINQLIDAADKAMYHAKKSGKGKCHLA